MADKIETSVNVIVANSNYKIVCADSLLYLESLPDKSFDVCFMDPPYNIGKKYNSHDDNMDINDYLSFLKSYFNQAKRIAENILVTPGIANISLWIKYIAEPNTIVALYTSANTSFSGKTWAPWEPLLHYGKDELKSNFLKTDNYVVENIYISKYHPCPKNLTIMKKVFANFYEDNYPRTVIDPFLGSGTTLKACYDMGIYAVGIDKDLKYCELSKQRLAQRRLV